MVIRYEGPKEVRECEGSSGAHLCIAGAGMSESVILITMAKFSGAPEGPCIGHVSPEAAVGGPIALVRPGDMISINIPARKLDLLVDPAELERRRSEWKMPDMPENAIKTGFWRVTGSR